MKTLKVCIGSACHVKGSYEVMSTFKELIRLYHLEEEIELHAEFCLKNCTQAVSVLRWDNKLLSVSPENIRAIFKDEIIAYL